MRFEGKTAIVTGAGYGIGEAIAMALAREGARVVLAARSREKIQAVAHAIEGMDRKALAIPTDIVEEHAVERMIERTIHEFGRVDILVNNAGIAGPTRPITEITAEEWDETVDINLRGAFFCAKHVARRMIPAGRGSIVNVSSVAGRIGYPMRSPYAASKWGMIGLSHTLAAELGDKGIRVNCVCPGPVAGDRMNDVIAARAKAMGITVEAAHHATVRGTPLNRMVTADEVAQAVLFLAGEDSSGMTGQAFNVCGGLRMQ